MQTTKKSKIFLVLLFLVALLFVSCSFEDTLGTPGRNTNAGENVGSGGGIGGSGENKGASIPKIYHGKYTEVVSIYPSYITIGNDNKGDYIIQDGGNKEYVKDLEYADENTWEQVILNDGYYLTTWQYTIKFEKNKRIFLFTYIKTHIDRGHIFTNHQYLYIHNEDRNK